VSGGVFGLAERMVLAEISVRVAIGGDGDANRRREQTVRLVRGVFGNHREYYFPGMQIRQPLRAWNELAVGRKDGRDTNQVLRGDAGVAQSEFERGETLPMFSHTFGEEDFLGNHVLAQFSFLPRNSSCNLVFDLKGKSNTAICEDCMKKRRETGFSHGPLAGRPMAARRQGFASE